MQLALSKDIGDISLNDISRVIASFLRIEVVRKTSFITFSAGVMTLIIIQSGTSYTPPLDVFVYCVVYSSWITMCLPWLVQNMNGKLLGSLIGVVFRLFAVDVGVLAWSAFRGQRNILQRGLRMRPMFEPSMSWLAEAGYNLRYGVVISAIVASAISFLMDFYEKLCKKVNIPRKSVNSKNSNVWHASDNSSACDTAYANRNPLRPSDDQESEDLDATESKTFRPGNTVRFNITDNGGVTEEPGSTDLRSNGKRGYVGDTQCLPVTRSDTDGEENSSAKDRISQENLLLKSECAPIISYSSQTGLKNNYNVRGSSYTDNSLGSIGFRTHGVYREPRSISHVNDDRLKGDRLLGNAASQQWKGKPQLRRSESANRETNRSQTSYGRIREGCARRDHASYTSDENKATYGKANSKEIMEEALTESMDGLKKLRGKM